MKKFLIIFCTISIALNLLLFFCLAIKDEEYKIQLENINSNKITEKTAEDYKKENIVFLGDSITDWCPFEELYEDYIPIVNSGKAGYKTQDILSELEELVYQYNPSKVIILIGTNDIAGGVSENEIISNIEKIVTNIQKKRKHAHIYIQSIYPVNNTNVEKINKKTVGKRENSDIKKINKKIKKICNEKKATYINMYKELVDKDGNLFIDYTSDGLHISKLGYLKIARKMLPYLEM